MEHPKVPVARDIMTRSLVTLTPETSGVDAARTLLGKAISGAPVVDAEGRLVGLLSEYDCLRAVAAAEYEMDAHDATVTVAELMTEACHTVGPDVDLFAIAHEFVQKRVRRLPVVDEGRLLGQVSRRDALRAALTLREALQKHRSRYPDYPAERAPIRNYPR